MAEWKECKLEEFANIIMGQSPESSYYNSNREGIPFLQGNRTFGFKYPTFDTYTTFITKEAIKDDVIMSVRAPVGDLNIAPERLCLGRGVCSLRAINGEQVFLFYLIKANQKKLLNKENGTVFGSVNRNDISNLIIKVPPLEIQKKIAAILSSLDDKIELNNKINANLEQQAQTLFKELFLKQIKKLTVENSKPLGELIDIIDNRGKTPPVSTERNCFPILDVGALNSNGRIIDYKNCTKFVDENTFNTFFRNGHPQENDILLSTVGSLAQMKFFKGNIGCIAQNVVAFRTKKLSPVYLYEYLKFIRNDLLAYNIGSVQPSIKVTHIIKHLIYIPTENEISFFDSFSKSITEHIYNNVCENDRLISIRDTLLSKLMSGEIEVDKLII